MDALLDNKKLTCRGCHDYLEPPLQVCSTDYAHLFCGKCNGKYEECVICNGKVIDLSPRLQETFLAQPYPCKYHLSGCNAMLVLIEKGNHEYECNFKIFKCEYGRFCGKPPCNWEGPYSEIQHHFRSKHIRHPFSKNLPLSVQMRIPGRTFNFIQMIQAHNELFWFKYRIDGDKQKVFFMLQMIGTKEQASEFAYELEIISLIDANNAITFNEKCYSDSENITNIFESEQCAVVSFSKIKNFIIDNKLTFNYNIKKRNQKFAKNPNLTSNPVNVQKQNNIKKNHDKPRHNQRRNRAQMGNSKSRDHSTGSNVSKKGQNSKFEVLDFKDFEKQLPPTSNIENKIRSDNFESVFVDKSSQATRNLAPPAYAVIDPITGRSINSQQQPPNYQKATSTRNNNILFTSDAATCTVPSEKQPNSVRNTPNNIQHPVNQNRVGTPTGNNTVPLHQQPPNYQKATSIRNNNILFTSDAATCTVPSEKQPNSVRNTPNIIQHPVNQNRVDTPTGNNTVPLHQASSSTRQANNSNYNANQYSNYSANQSTQYRASKERKTNKADNCVIS